ncbi:hypothetical protein N7468_001276 [Penicillium chermesinum]|uniref:Zn(2)-C6 fungal-type domain-containing protein n=1 Tax=Penicillium chermesinum TaxID=63820 RepID=A0A9W9TX66_9EURO|nr:uncharacterized protein N7468_001276 [Penicillium chermesinum]KAJ5246293.1 hypothetical protein N7468_001276 [Penicillium chermesinum]KAJ6144580.1 hypothetical protein N7470_008475 [Penicillium chermesinum]
MTDRVRRNGQLSSCEPCRKSKLRCDHKRPICGRCARRRLSEQQCHYHPAPMAKQLTPLSEKGLPSQRQATDSMTAASSPVTGSFRSYEPVNMNGNLLCFADPNTATAPRPYISLTTSGVTTPQLFEPNIDMIAEGAKLLDDILGLITEIGEPLESLSTDDNCCSFHGPLVEASWKATDSSMRSLIDDRSVATLQSVSRAIFERTSLPPFFPPTAADGALGAAFASQALRWDLIGLYCAQIGVYLGGERDKSFNPMIHKTWKSDRKTLMQKTFQMCLQCESFCNVVGSVNDFAIWFLTMTMLYATWCFGDDSYHVMRLMGSISSVFFAMGFHKGCQNDGSIPFYMVEIRKRIIGWVHDHDKVQATFTSRPVHLSRHFCTIEMPLDVPDSVLTDTTETFLRACEDLDENGWNTQKAVLPVSRQRVQIMLCVIREETLELRMGSAAPDIEVKAARVLRKLKSTWQSIPPHMRFETMQRKLDQKDDVSIHSLRLEYLYTEFLLYTLLANSGGDARVNLIKVAHEVLNLVLLPTRKRDLLQSNRANMEWTLVFYAMPCASVLIIELMRHKRHPEEQPITNRSGIIQDISVLISCCDSLTETGQSNYQICKQAQSIFSRSLDSILNHSELSQASAGHPSMNHHEYPEQSRQERMSSVSSEPPNVVIQDPEWTAWLDSIGLQGDPWFDSIIPTLELPTNEI